MEARKVVLFGGHGIGIANNKKQSEWQHVAAAVNSVSSKERTVPELKKKWPLPCGYTGTMKATTLVLLVLLDCLLVSSSRPFRSSSGGPPMVCNFIKSDVEES
ncbi:unnamed protein product [Boreogadus saida]